MTQPAPTTIAVPAARRQGFTAWPLLLTATGVLAAVGTFITDVRPAAENEAIDRGETYAVTPADMDTLDILTNRVGYTAGFVAVVLLLICAALWRTRVERQHPESAAAALVSAGFIASAAGYTFGYAWKGALANYMGPEAGLYDEKGLFVYYMLTDFGAYIPGLGVMVAAGATVWLAFGVRLVSRILGTLSVLLVLASAGGAFVIGVPGIPGIVATAWLAIAGLWLAFGRSRIVRAGVTA